MAKKKFLDKGGAQRVVDKTLIITRPRIIRAGFARTEMKPHFAYKAKMMITDDVYISNDGKTVRHQYPAVVVSGFKRNKTTADYPCSVSLETAFPGGKFMGKNIEFYCGHSNDGVFTYDRASNTVTCHRKPPYQNGCYVILKGAKLKGMYLTTDKAGKVIAVDGSTCKEEYLRALTASDIELVKIDRYYKCLKAGGYKLGYKEAWAIRLREIDVADSFGNTITTRARYGMDVHIELQVKTRRWRHEDVIRRRITRWRSTAKLLKKASTFRARAVTRSARSEWRYFTYYTKADTKGFVKAHIKEIRIGEGEMPLHCNYEDGSIGRYTGKWRKKKKNKA